MMEDSMDIDIDIGENVEYGDHQTHAILSVITPFSTNKLLLIIT